MDWMDKNTMLILLKKHAITIIVMLKLLEIIYIDAYTKKKNGI